MLLPCCTRVGVEALHGRKLVKSRACVRIEDDHVVVRRAAFAGMATDADVAPRWRALFYASQIQKKIKPPPLLPRLEWLGFRGTVLSLASLGTKMSRELSLDLPPLD